MNKKPNSSINNDATSSNTLFYRHKYEVREIYPFSPSIKYDLQNASHHRIH